MKKIVYLILAIAIFASALCALAACKSDELTLYVPDGAPALSVAKIIDEGKIGGGVKLGSRKVRTTVTTGEDVIAKCGSGEADMAVLPTNAAVKICATRGDYMIFSVNVYGVLYIVGSEQLTDLKQLEGKRLYSIGLGNTPEYVFKTVCDGKEVQYEEYDGDRTLYGKVMLKYFSDASEIIPQVLQGKADFALVGEPAATQLMSKLLEQGKTAYNLFDLQQLWKETVKSQRDGYPQASLIVKKSLYTAALQRWLDTSLRENEAFLRENVGRVKDILQSVGSSLTIRFTDEIITRCNLAYVPAADAKEDIETYLDKFKGMEQFLPLSPSLFGNE